MPRAPSACHPFTADFMYVCVCAEMSSQTGSGSSSSVGTHCESSTDGYGVCVQMSLF